MSHCVDEYRSEKHVGQRCRDIAARCHFSRHALRADIIQQCLEHTCIEVAHLSQSRQTCAFFAFAGCEGREYAGVLADPRAD